MPRSRIATLAFVVLVAGMPPDARIRRDRRALVRVGAGVDRRRVRRIRRASRHRRRSPTRSRRRGSSPALSRGRGDRRERRAWHDGGRRDRPLRPRGRDRPSVLDGRRGSRGPDDSAAATRLAPSPVTTRSPDRVRVRAGHCGRCGQIALARTGGVGYRPHRDRRAPRRGDAGAHGTAKSRRRGSTTSTPASSTSSHLLEGRPRGGIADVSEGRMAGTLRARRRREGVAVRPRDRP